MTRAASRTALMVASYRGRASARPNPLIDDPWARALGGDEGDAICTEIDRFLVDRELWVAVRTAYIDRAIRRSLERNPRMRQVVILGAGLDTRAARLAAPGIRFFEVDHAESQREKLERLAALPNYPREAATYVSCDFEREAFLDRLTAARFDPNAPAFVLWEGVTPYLVEDAVRSTLRVIASSLHAESVLLFDHMMKRFIEGQGGPDGDVALRAVLDRLGERMVFGTNDALPMLFDAGFRDVGSVSFDEICLAYTGTYDRQRAFRFQRIVMASRTRGAVTPID